MEIKNRQILKNDTWKNSFFENAESTGWQNLKSIDMTGFKGCEIVFLRKVRAVLSFFAHIFKKAYINLVYKYGKN